MDRINSLRLLSLICLLCLVSVISQFATAQPPQRQPTPNDTLGAPEISTDRKVSFRIYAPKATSVRLAGSDIPGNQSGAAMTKAENGVWEVTLGPIEPGAYRYNFNVDGVSVIDPRSPAVSESNNNVWSMVYVPGADFMDTKNVPRGAVSSVTYYSTALGKFRRMHVYTPPGYESGQGKYPVFYLLHGAGDCDDSWSSVGRAGFILDNLIAAKKARPMVVVMPAGHTRPFGRGAAPAAPSSGGAPPPDEFVQDFVTDIMPYVEKNYRLLPGRASRAIAGLSMGGAQTLNVAIPNLEKFSYVGVFSSGLISGFNRPAPGAEAPSGPPQISPAGEAWEKQHQPKLDNSELKKGLKLFWFSTGKEDFLLNITKGTVSLFQKHGFNPVYVESPGGHTWINWRNYLNDFAPQLFQ